MSLEHWRDKVLTQFVSYIAALRAQFEFTLHRYKLQLLDPLLSGHTTSNPYFYQVGFMARALC